MMAGRRSTCGAWGACLVMFELLALDANRIPLGHESSLTRGNTTRTRNSADDGDLASALVIGKEGAGCPVERPWRSPVVPAADRGLFAASGILLPSADGGAGATGSVPLTPAH
jgi:hypothetical protein